MHERRLLLGLGAVVLAAFCWSAIAPADYGTWLFEIGPGTAGVLVLVAVGKRFRFTPVVYVLVAAHFVILAAGAKYTYARMPLFDWLRDELGLARNHFDRVGHFAQGFVPAMILRELLVRKSPLRPGALLFFLVTATCLAFSAFYELCELWVVLAFYPDTGPAWLGHQGDPWDAQWDMTMALAGALLAQLCLARVQDRQLNFRTVPGTNVR